MKPPKWLPSTLVVLGESFALRANIPVGDFWAYVFRKKSMPDELRRQWVETFFPRVSPDDFLSTAHEDGSTIRTMRTETFAPPKKGRPPVLTHPLFEALAKHGKTLTDEALAIRRSEASIRSMCYPKGSKNRRPAPDDLQKRWHEEYGVPYKAWR